MTQPKHKQINKISRGKSNNGGHHVTRPQPYIASVSFQHQICDVLLLVVSYFLILIFLTNYFSTYHVLQQCFSDAGGAPLKIVRALSLLTMKVQVKYCWEPQLAVWGRTCPDVTQEYETCTPLAVHSLGYYMFVGSSFLYLSYLL